MDSNHGPPRYKLGALPTELYSLLFGSKDCIRHYVKRKPLSPLVYTNHMKINEFVAKKLGEVLAFNRIGTETLEKGRSALLTVLGEENVLDREEKNRIHGEAVLKIATESSVIDITLEKAKKTEEKLRIMRDLYVADQWDNATELLEWSGFFEGAAIVHWALVRGAGESLNNETIITVANEAISYHYELLEKSESELGTKGQDKAQS